MRHALQMFFFFSPVSVYYIFVQQSAIEIPPLNAAFAIMRDKAYHLQRLLPPRRAARPTILNRRMSGQVAFDSDFSCLSHLTVNDSCRYATPASCARCLRRDEQE